MNRIDAIARAPSALTGWHVLVMIVGFFAVVIGVDMTFLVMAIRSNPGAVSVTPYEDGLLYNRRIAQLEAQTRLGWQAAAAIEPGGIVVVLRDRDGRPVPGLAVTGTLERPATGAGRITVTFKEASPGRYEASVDALTGAWDLTAEARQGGRLAFTAERRLTWP